MQKNDDRTRKIVELREQGKTYKEIAELFGVTPERIRQIYLRELWRRESDKKTKSQEEQNDQFSPKVFRRL